MKVSFNWLKDYIDLTNVTTEELSKLIAAHVVEIEEEYPLTTATNLEVGYVKECEEVEGTHLHKCQIELSDGVSQTVSLLGVTNMIVAVTKDNMLICDKSKNQDIKKIIKLI